MYELLLAKWHLPPDYINDNWTDELLQLMIEKFMERIETIQKELPSGLYEGVRTVSDIALFNQMGIKIHKA